MAMAVLFFALIPLFISIGRANNPFLISSAIRVGMVAFCALVLVIFYLRLLKGEGVLDYIRQRSFSREIFLVLIGHFEVVVFALSLRWIDPSATAILFEIWPILLIFVVARWTGGESRRLDRQMLAFVVIAFVGVVFVLASQSGGWEILLADFSGDASSGAYIGVLLALGSAFLSALAGFGWVWSYKAINDDRLPDALKSEVSGNSLEMFFLLVGFTITCAISAVIHGIIGFSVEGIRFEFANVSGIYVALLGGALIGCGNVLWRFATAMTFDMGIHAMSYFTPVISIVILFVAGQVGDVRVDYFLIGTMAIVVSNLLIRFEAEIRLGFKALLMALVVAGALVYLREGIFEAFNVGDWHWTASGYFEAVALAATVFTLLLAFRVVRLVDRSSAEDSLTYTAFSKFELLVNRNVIRGEILNLVLQIGAARNDIELRSRYLEAQRIIASTVIRSDDPNSQILSEATAQLNELVRSKQSGLILGELFGLAIFAGITIALALATRPPEAEAWTRFLVDAFAMLITAVIVFLMVNVWDLHRERSELRLVQDQESGSFIVHFHDAERRLADQWLSVIVGLGVVVTYCGLFGYKWLG